MTKKKQRVKPNYKKKEKLKGKTTNKQPEKMYLDEKDIRFPHFRLYYKSNHPALITGEYSKDEWQYRKVLHGEKDGRNAVDTISPNPDLNDPTPMHIVRRKRHDKKIFFSKWQYGWKIIIKKE